MHVPGAVELTSTIASGARRAQSHGTRREIGEAAEGWRGGDLSRDRGEQPSQRGATPGREPQAQRPGLDAPQPRRALERCVDAACDGREDEFVEVVGRGDEASHFLAGCQENPVTIGAKYEFTVTAEARVSVAF